MGLVFKSLCAGGVRYRRVAARLANQLIASGGGVQHQLVDGYILRGVRSGSTVTVYVLDPDVVWAFLHHSTLESFGAQLKQASRHLNRDTLRPGLDLTDLLPEADVVEKDADTTLLPYSPGQGFYHDIDTDATLIRNNFPSVPYSQPARCGTCVLAATSGNVQARFDTDRFQLWCDAFSAVGQPKFYKPDADTSEFRGTNTRMQAWLLPEAGLQALTGDLDARFYTRQMSRYASSYRIPTLGAQCSRDGFGSWDNEQNRWGEAIVGGAYVSQPDSDDVAPSPPEDFARAGTTGVFLFKFLRPAVPQTNSYRITSTHVFFENALDNPEIELRPVIVEGDAVEPYEPHGVSGVALCYALDDDYDTPPDGSGPRGGTTLFYTCHRKDTQTSTVWSSVQLRTIPSSGAQSSATLYKANDGVDPRVGHELGPDVPMFGKAGIVGARYSIVEGKQDQTTTEFIHYGVDGTIRPSGLLAAGWYPFTQIILNTLDVTAGTTFGQSSHFAAAIGADLVAVLARNYVVLEDADTVEWAVVVVRQDTGEFVEARGVMGSGFTTAYSAHITVITPEVAATDDKPAIPAVLAGALGSKHYLSADGGMTWAQVFDGFVGKPVYLGNQLHEIEFETDL